MHGKSSKQKESAGRVTGKELTDIEEAVVKLNVLIDELQRMGVIDKKGYERLVAMRLHELSKAKAFETLNEEI